MEAMTRKWGNSLGVALPQRVIREEKLHENQKIIIEIKRATDLTKLRGLMKFTKTVQQLKDEMRAGWE